MMVAIAVNAVGSLGVVAVIALASYLACKLDDTFEFYFTFATIGLVFGAAWTLAYVSFVAWVLRCCQV
jgi:hypothetical protein